MKKYLSFQQYRVHRFLNVNDNLYTIHRGTFIFQNHFTQGKRTLTVVPLIILYISNCWPFSHSIVLPLSFLIKVRFDTVSVCRFKSKVLVDPLPILPPFFKISRPSAYHAALLIVLQAGIVFIVFVRILPYTE